MMMRKLLLFALIFTVAFTACKKDVKDQPNPNPNPNMDELVIPDGFNWETTRDISLKVAVQTNQSVAAKSKISVYKGNPATDGVLLVSGGAAAGQDFTAKIRIPSYLNELYLQCEFPFGGTKVTAINVSDDMISYTFSNEKNADVDGFKASTETGPECTDCDHEISGSGSYNISNGEKYCVTGDFNGSITFQSWNGGGTLQVCGNANISNLQLTKDAHIIVTQDGSLTIGNFSSWGDNGTITVYENATLTFNHNFQTQGDYVENQGTLVVHGNLQIQNLTSGNFTNSGTLTVDGNVEVNGNHTLYNNGTILANGSSFKLNNDAACENNGTMTLGTTSDNHFETNSNSAFTNNGTLDVIGDIDINAGSIVVNNCAMMCSGTFDVNSGDFKNYSGFLKGAQKITLNQNDNIELHDGSMLSTVDLTMNSGGVKGFGSLNSILVTGTMTVHSNTKVDGPVETATDDLNISSGGIPDHFINGATVVGLDAITNYIAPGACNPDGIGSPGITDTDNDGVPDDQDDYPEDPYRAYNSYFPDENSYASVLFEDLWPAKGDYDFNDLVLGVYGTEVTNADNEVVEIFINFNVRAVGASFQNGFGWQFAGITPSEIQQVSGMVLRPSGESYVSLSANGTEQGQDSAVIIAIENVEDVINRVGGSMYNTLDNGLVGVSDLVQMHVLFGETTPISRDRIGPSAYNVFLIKDQDRGVEIHLADRRPTNLMTHPLGTNEDTSDPSTGRYYKTSGNLPWGLLMVEPFDYPIEKVPIVEAYPDFAGWAQSGGTINQDWYLHPDPAKIWTP